MSTARRALLRTAAALVLWTPLLLTVGSNPADAHEGLIAAVPAPGEVVGGQVDVVQMWFGEPVAEFTIVIRDDEGNEIGEEVTQPVEGLLEVTIQPLVGGDYVVAYDIIYEDEAPAEAVYRFTYDGDAAPPIPLTVTGGGSSSLARSALWVLVVAIVVLILMLGWRARQIQLARLDAVE